MTSIASSFPPPEATTVLSEVQHDLLSPTRPRARTFEAELQDGEMSEIELKAEVSDNNSTVLNLDRSFTS